MFREIGRPIEPSNALPLNSAFDFFPICFSQQINFVQEFSDAGAKRHPVEGEPNPYGVIAAIINAERECTKFTGWQQGFTPKEHREILDRQWMTDREDRRDVDQRKFQERLHREQIVIMGFGIILATILAAVIAALITKL